MMLRELGRPALDVELIRTFVGKGIPKLVERALAGSIAGGASAGQMARALPLLRALLRRGQRPPHRDLSGRERRARGVARACGLPLACVTNKSGRFTLPLLEHLGIARYFEQVIAGDTLPQKKPDPAPLLHACRGFGIAPREMLMIGDSVNDVAGRARGRLPGVLRSLRLQRGPGCARARR